MHRRRTWLCREQVRSFLMFKGYCALGIVPPDFHGFFVLNPLNNADIVVSILQERKQKLREFLWSQDLEAE